MQMYIYIFIFIFLADSSGEIALSENVAAPAPAVTDAVQLLGDDTFDTPEVETIAKDILAMEQDSASSDPQPDTQQVR